MSREIESIRVEFIESLPGRRPVNPETVSRLMESIKRIGLRTPLSVRLVDGYEVDGESVDGQPVLVTGAHRLEAVRRLGWEKVECFVLSDETEAQAKMWEIAENLHRAELTALERDENVAEWIRLAEQSDKPSQVATVKKGGRGKKEGIRKAASELGIDKDAAHRAVKVASLTPEAKQVARDLKLDNNRSALLSAAREAPEKQAEALRTIEAAKHEPKPPKQAASIQKPIDKALDIPEWTAEHESSFAALCDAWEAAPHEARVQFLAQLPSRYRSAA